MSKLFYVVYVKRKSALQRIFIQIATAPAARLILIQSVKIISTYIFIKCRFILSRPKKSVMCYSLFATCKLHSIEPMQCLTEVLAEIKDHPINKIHELLPQKYYPVCEVQ